MIKYTSGLIAALTWVALPIAAAALDVVTTPAKPGAVRGATENSDAFIWRLMTSQIAAPVTKGQPLPANFETWASDNDLYIKSPPTWPGTSAAHVFQASVLAAAKTVTPNSYATVTFDAGCVSPNNAWLGNFPIGGTPTPCIAEEVKRNKVEFDYLVKNNLYTRKGLATAFANGFNVQMPAAAVSVKGDWLPVATLLRWLPRLHDQATIEKVYLTTTADAIEYALVALHVSSKQNQAWVWGTFEHRYNPGRCDVIGCHDTFGAVTPTVPPNKQTPNSQYGACTKTDALKTMMSQAGLSSVWQNYCLKGTQVDYVASDGTPYVLGNSVIEGINANEDLAAASCISCHANASYGANGQPTAAAFSMLGHNPNGKPVSRALVGSRAYDFYVGRAAGEVIAHGLAAPGKKLLSLTELHSMRRVSSLMQEGMVEMTQHGRLRVSPSGFPLLDAVVADLAA